MRASNHTAKTRRTRLPTHVLSVPSTTDQAKMILARNAARHKNGWQVFRSDLLVVGAALVAAAVLVLAGCASGVSIKQAYAECKKEGFKLGTDELHDCTSRKAFPKDADRLIAERKMEKERSERQFRGWVAQCSALFPTPEVLSTQRDIQLAAAQYACVQDKFELNARMDRLQSELIDSVRARSGTTVLMPAPEGPRQPICLVMKNGVCTQFGTTR
jgi:hypothetical protein